MINLAFETADPVESSVESLPAIILLHGITSSKLTWQTFLQPLADATGRKVFALDARDHGDSGWSDKFDYVLMLEDLLHFMESSNMERASLIGHSMGGRTAMRFALKSPERVDKLLIEDITPKNLPPESRQYPYQYIQLLKHSLDFIPDGSNLEKAKDVVASFMQDKIPPEHRSEKSLRLGHSELPLKIGEDGKFQWKANLAVIEDCILHGFRNSSELQGQFTGPTLFLYGSKSPYNVINDKELVLKLFPSALFSEFKGAGHSLHAEYPETFLRRVVDFINTS